MRRAIGIAALAATVAACGDSGVYRGEVNVHPCTIMTVEDAAEVLGGPVTAPQRQYVRGRLAHRLGPCAFELQANDEARILVSLGDETVDGFGVIENGTPLDDLGAEALWWSDVDSVDLDVLSDDGVVVSFTVGIPGTPPDATLDRLRPVVERLLDRLAEELPGADRASDVPEPPVDHCALVTEADRAATLGAPASFQLWTHVGGRYGGGWNCVYWADRPDDTFNSVINVYLTAQTPTRDELLAAINGATLVDGVGALAYWEPREEVADRYAGTLTVLSERGNHFEVTVGLADAAREQPEAVRLARALLAHL